MNFLNTEIYEKELGQKIDEIIETLCARLKLSLALQQKKTTQIPIPDYLETIIISSVRKNQSSEEITKGNFKFEVIGSHDGEISFKIYDNTISKRNYIAKFNWLIEEDSDNDTKHLVNTHRFIHNGDSENPNNYRGGSLSTKIESIIINFCRRYKIEKIKFASRDITNISWAINHGYKMPDKKETKERIKHKLISRLTDKSPVDNEIDEYLFLEKPITP